jgi:hypothetical protein
MGSFVRATLVLVLLLAVNVPASAWNTRFRVRNYGSLFVWVDVNCKTAGGQKKCDNYILAPHGRGGYDHDSYDLDVISIHATMRTAYSVGKNQGPVVCTVVAETKIQPGEDAQYWDIEDQPCRIKRS